MAHHHHHQPFMIKPRHFEFNKVSSAIFLKEVARQEKFRLVRLSMLLLLVISAAVSVFRLQAAITLFAETGIAYDSESLRTHISSTNNNLQDQEEKSRSSASFSCSDLIDAKLANSITHDGLLCCNRSHYRTDVCYMKGDIRTDSQSSSVLLYGAETENANGTETIRPYTRKWEKSIMSTIDEITLRPIPFTNNDSNIVTNLQCDVHHNVPAIMFSTGGYTGNVYHEFNDGLIPLYITAERFKGEVVLVVLEYHSWWKTKYKEVVKKISNYKMVDFANDSRVHCFPEMIVGLKIHGELTVDPNLMHEGKGIKDFQTLVGQGFSPNQSIIQSELSQQQQPTRRPKLAIFIRNKSRMIQNLRQLIKLCEKTGFDVQIFNPRRTTPLSDIYAGLNSSDAMLAVHGAAMTHFLFLQPGSVLIQIVPLGLEWASEEYYAEPARKLGLNYIGYKISPEESSLYRQYGHHSTVIRDPDAITSKGWAETKKTYLDHQNVRLNLKKFGRLVTKAYSHIVHRLWDRISVT